jgi:CubicO group peptidase (beta-lactamase class C family)
LEEHVRGLKAIQLTRPVGETYQYSSLNYNIAGLVVEKVSGQSYADYVTQHIYEPLDMRHSYASRAPAPWASGWPASRATSYREIHRSEASFGGSL